jgi:hypothetical protein
MVAVSRLQGYVGLCFIRGSRHRVSSEARTSMSPYVIDLDSGAMAKLLMQVIMAAIPTTDSEERHSRML